MCSPHTSSLEPFPSCRANWKKRRWRIVVGVISLDTVVASLQDHLLLALGNEVVNGDVGILNPVGGGVIERHIKTVLGDREQVCPLFGGGMIATRVHLEDELVVRGVTNTEGLDLGIEEVGA